MDERETPWIELLCEAGDTPLRLRVLGHSMWPTLQPGDEVTVEPARAEDLRPGDWVVVRQLGTLFLHRFLRFTAEGHLLTKGDHHRAPDAPWPRKVLLGRVVTIQRDGREIPVAPTLPAERVRTTLHRLEASLWRFVRAVKHRRARLDRKQ